MCGGVMTVSTPLSFTSSALLRSVNAILGRDALTYRMLDYWSRTGFQPELEKPVSCGVPRAWTLNDVRIVLTVAQLAELVTGPKPVPAIAELLRTNRHEAGGIVLSRSDVQWCWTTLPREAYLFVPVPALAVVEAQIAAVSR